MSTYNPGPQAGLVLGLPSFEVTFGAWNPAGAPPTGMPADAINLAALGSTQSYAIDSEVPSAQWWIIAVVVRSGPTTLIPFGVGGTDTDLEIDVGTPADSVAALSGSVTTLAQGLAYTATVPLNPAPARITVDIDPSFHFSQLTRGQATVVVVLQPTTNALAHV